MATTTRHYQIAVIRDGRLYINNQFATIPGNPRNVKMTQVNEKVYLNGFEWHNGEWKRTPAAIFHYFF